MLVTNSFYVPLEESKKDLSYDLINKKLIYLKKRNNRLALTAYDADFLSLKQALLLYKVSKENKYLDLYLELLFKNKNRKKERKITNAHHAIPVGVYRKLSDRLFKSEARILSDFDKNNLIINLPLEYHFIGHILLYLAGRETEYSRCLAASLHAFKNKALKNNTYEDINFDKVKKIIMDEYNGDEAMLE